jgi:hypothetical protein
MSLDAWVDLVLLILLIALLVWVLIAKMSSLKRWTYDVTLTTGEKFIAIKTLGDWWNDNPWRRYYTVVESTSYPKGSKLSIWSRRIAQSVQLDITKKQPAYYTLR